MQPQRGVAGGKPNSEKGCYPYNTSPVNYFEKNCRHDTDIAEVQTWKPSKSLRNSLSALTVDDTADQRRGKFLPHYAFQLAKKTRSPLKHSTRPTNSRQDSIFATSAASISTAHHPPTFLLLFLFFSSPTVAPSVGACCCRSLRSLTRSVRLQAVLWTRRCRCAMTPLSTPERRIPPVTLFMG
jgi:hypothetical protein